MALLLLALLPPMVLLHVVAVLCPSIGVLQVVLLWPFVTRYPCVQQYPVGSRQLRALALAGFGAVGAVWAACPAKSMYAEVSVAKLAVREVTFAMSVALFLISVARVVCSVVAAAARLSRYPSRRTKVSCGMVSSSPPIAAFAVSTRSPDHPAASSCRLRAMWVVR